MSFKKTLKLALKLPVKKSMLWLSLFNWLLAILLPVIFINTSYNEHWHWTMPVNKRNLDLIN